MPYRHFIFGVISSYLVKRCYSHSSVFFLLISKISFNFSENYFNRKKNRNVYLNSLPLFVRASQLIRRHFYLQDVAIRSFSPRIGDDDDDNIVDFHIFVYFSILDINKTCMCAVCAYSRSFDVSHIVERFCMHKFSWTHHQCK